MLIAVRYDSSGPSKLIASEMLLV